MSGSALLTAVGEGQTTIQAVFGSVNGSTSLTVDGSSFITVGTLITPRYGHTATLLSNGTVLIAGGEDSNNQVLASAEIYDPATETFSATGSLTTPRMGHTATLLPDGTVLITGGENFMGGGSIQTLSSAEIYDPATGTFSLTSSMNNAQIDHTATLLNSGQVLIAGGHYINPEGGGGYSDSELYDPSAKTFTVTGSMVTPRMSPTATLLNDGTVLIAGGTDSEGNYIASAEIFDPTTGLFTTAANFNTPRLYNTATLLNGGTVLFAGGNYYSLTSPDPILATTEIYDPVAKAFAFGPSLAIARSGHTATLLNNESVLVVGGQVPATIDGQTTTTDSGTGELFVPSTQTFTGAGSLQFPRSDHTATLLNDGTVLVVGGEGLDGVVGPAELYAVPPPAPSSVKVTPVAVNLNVGDSQQFSAVTEVGYPRTDVSWVVSDPSLASITSDSSPTLTALSTGTVTLTATVEGVSGQAQITISAAGTTPSPGATLWSVASVPGFSIQQLAQAIPSETGSPDLYLIQSTSDGSGSLVQALTIDGQQMWQSQFPSLNGNSTPDAFGGVLVTENQTCSQGQTVPMTIADVDPGTGQTLWQISAAGLPGAGPGGTTLYCYPDAPQLAIRGDGAIAISAPGNTSGLPELQIVNGQTAQLISEPYIPPSSYTEQNGTVLNGYSPIGPPIVDSDGSTYVEYEVVQVAYPPQITSATLYLLKVSLDGTVTTTQLSSTNADENLFPERIIPDGQGNVLATWVIDPASGAIPTNPYQAAYVVSGSISASYNLPFTPSNFVLGPDGLPVNPSLVLGENGIAFATDGTSSGDSTNGEGPKIVSFNINSGSVNWTYQVPTQTTVSLLASASGGGIAAKSTLNGVDTVLDFDSSGNASTDFGAGSSVGNFGGDFWIGYSSSGNSVSAYYGSPVELSSSPFYGPDGNGGNAAIQNVSVTNFSTQGTNQSTITEVLQELQAALPSNGTCNAWLVGSGKGAGTSGLQEIQDLLQSVAYGHGTVNVGSNISYETWAFSGDVNPDHTLVNGLPTGIALTVNDAGGFFNTNAPDGPPYNGVQFKLGPHHYLGNTLRAQAATLIHEVAHQITVAGFQDDFGNNKAEEANNKAVVTNCGQLIEGLQ
ncbi:MAG TPA: kelch repeat-containing protein [Verrucomicrobiae bacterium]|nr:kelch repeat-containing protein [Verrucomicrobiae bacterium]